MGEEKVISCGQKERGVFQSIRIPALHCTHCKGEGEMSSIGEGVMVSPGEERCGLSVGKVVMVFI